MDRGADMALPVDRGADAGRAAADAGPTRRHGPTCNMAPPADAAPPTDMASPDAGPLPCHPRQEMARATTASS
ncbi:MAG: hypothetical protein R3F43_18505 [bacterium]